MSELIETRLTPVKLHSDGAPDVERTYDDQGNLVRAIYFTDTREGPQTEVLTIDLRRRIRTRDFTRRGRVVRSEVERYAGREVLLERETSWAEGGDRLNRRTVETFLGVSVQVDDYALKDGNWEKTGSVHRSGLHIRGSAPPPFEATSESRLYAECMSERANPTDPDALIDPYYSGHVDVASCMRQLTDLVSATGIDYERYANLRCWSRTELFLPNGFRIDRASCFGLPPDFRGSANARGWTHDVLDRAARRVTEDSGGMIACLNVINAPLARKVARALAEKRPRIQCRGNADQAALEGAVCPDATGTALDSCRSTLAPLRDHAGAFYVESRPNDIFLTDHDPANAYSASDPHKGVPPEVEASGDGRYPPNESVRQHYEDLLDERGDQLASTLFHELLHSAELHGSDHHNDAEGDLTDAVYGCQAVCGGASANLNREGCLACLGAEGNTPRRADRAACNGLPRKGAIDAATRIAGVSRSMYRCMQLFGEAQPRSDDEIGDFDRRITAVEESDACTGLERADGYPAECRGKYPWHSECRRHIRVWIGRLIRDGSKDFSAGELADGFTQSGGSYWADTSTGALAFPQVTLTGEAGSEEVSARKFMNLAVTHAFCSEVYLGATVSADGHTTSIDVEAASKIRAAYDKSLGSLPAADRSELVTFGTGDSTYPQPVWKGGGYGGERAWIGNLVEYCSRVTGSAGLRLYGASLAGVAALPE